MNSISKKYWISSLMILLIVGLFTTGISAQSVQIDEMNFKNAGVQDVLRTVAKVYDKNVVIDDSVSGNITITLDDVGFDEALRLITNAKGLSYKLDKNTIFVATPERINQLYDSKEMKIINLENIKPEEIISVLNNVFSDLIISPLPNNNQLVIKGLKDDVNTAIDFVNKIDQKFDKEVSNDYEIIDIYPENYNMISNSIKAMYPELTIVPSANNDKLLISGDKNTINQALEVIKRLNVKKESEKLEVEEEEEEKAEEEIETKIIITKRNIVDYIPIADAQSILENNYSDLTISTNPEFKELIIKGPEETVKNAAKFLDQIDRAQRQVKIEVRVEEISRSDIEELGINSLSEATPELPRVKFVKSPDGATIEGVEMQWPDILDYIKRNSKSETLANPHLITLNGKNGKLLIGDRIPVKTTNADGSESIKYIEAGITLEFTPWISQDDIIKLDVAPTVSSLGETKYEGYPTIQTREVETTLNLKNGETFAIGGLIQEDDTISKSAVPYLSEIPILGEIFKRTNEEQSKTELLIFITPKIIEDYKNIEGQTEFEYLNITEPLNE